jgi:phage/plasmid-associated DNA primase
MSCGYDYSDCIDTVKLQEVNALLNSIFPNPEKKQLILEILSGGLTGRAIEKFVLFNDGGRNGKGLLNDFVKITFGEYGLIYANASVSFK